MPDDSSLAQGYATLFPQGKDETKYRKLTSDHVSVTSFDGEEVIKVEPEGLRLLAEAAFCDINHLLRPGHLQQLRNILDDKEASSNDKFVALDLLKNANIAAAGTLPMCQDTGTAIVMGKKGRRIFTKGGDEAALSIGARDAYLKRNLRYSQLAPISMYEEKNTRNNLPGQVRSTRRARTPTSSCSWPRAAARPTRPSCTRPPRRCWRRTGC